MHAAAEVAGACSNVTVAAEEAAVADSRSSKSRSRAAVSSCAQQAHRPAVLATLELLNVVWPAVLTMAQSAAVAVGALPSNAVRGQQGAALGRGRGARTTR